MVKRTRIFLTKGIFFMLTFLFFSNIIEAKINFGITQAVKNKVKELKEEKAKATQMTGNLLTYFPLHQGDWWRYDDSDSEEYYSQYNTKNYGYQDGYWVFVTTQGENYDDGFWIDVSTDYYILSSEGLKLSGNKYYSYSTSQYFDGTSTYTYINISSDTCNFNPSLLYLKNQMNIGDMYYQAYERNCQEYYHYENYENGILLSSDTENYSDTTLTMSTFTILSLNASTTTSIGTFNNCLLLKIQYNEGSYSTGTILAYYAPNIGGPEGVSYSDYWYNKSLGDSVYHTELISYHTSSGGSYPQTVKSIKPASIVKPSSMPKTNYKLMDKNRVRRLKSIFPRIMIAK